MYTTWRVGDIVKLCAKVEDFCGATSLWFMFLVVSIGRSGDIERR